MAQMGVARTSEFEWQKQLRYYWEEEADDCIIRQTLERCPALMHRSGGTCGVVRRPWEPLGSPPLPLPYP